MSPKVSVIVPIYNCRQYLEKSLGSVLAQSFTDFELICIDDGSDDGSFEYAHHLAETYDQKMAVYTSDRQGPGVARNIGLSHARGEYLAFLDADDFMEETLLEKVVDQAEKTSSDIVIWDIWLYNDKLKRNQFPLLGTLNFHHFAKSDEQVFNYKDNPDQIFNSFQNWPWNKLFRRSLIVENDIVFQDIHRTEDLLFTCLSLVCASRISLVWERLTHYRSGREGSAMITKDEFAFDFIEGFRELKNQLVSRGLYEEVKRSYVNWAVASSLFNTVSLTTYPRYEEVYSALKDHAFAEMDILEHDDDYYYAEEWPQEVSFIRDKSAQEYLLYKYNRLCVKEKDTDAFIDKAFSDHHHELLALNERITSLEKELLREREHCAEVVKDRDEILQAAEQKVGAVLCWIPRVVQRAIIRWRRVQ